MERRCFVKLPMPGRPTNLENSKTQACCATVGAGGGCLDIFFCRLSVFSSPEPKAPGSL